LCCDTGWTESQQPSPKLPIDERLFYQTVYLMLGVVGLKLLYDSLAPLIG
jgi:hypothetical protein